MSIYKLIFTCVKFKYKSINPRKYPLPNPQFNYYVTLTIVIIHKYVAINPYINHLVELFFWLINQVIEFD